jgi:hypothetical protein
MAWEVLVDVETTTALRTTGGHVWNAARALFQFLAHTHVPGIEEDGVTVLELGAGCGWLGLNVAANLPDSAKVRNVSVLISGGMCVHCSSASRP